MKVKALVLGALPGSFEGPWVNLEDGQVWEVECTPKARGYVFVRRRNGFPPAQYALRDGIRIQDAERVRVVLKDSEVQASVHVRCVDA